MLHKYMTIRKQKHTYTEFLFSDNCHISSEYDLCYAFNNTNHKFYHATDNHVYEGDYYPYAPSMHDDTINIICVVLSAYHGFRDHTNNYCEFMVYLIAKIHANLFKMNVHFF